MKFFIIFLLIVLLVILIFNKNSESFMDEKIRAKLLNGIALNMGEIENLNSLVLKSPRISTASSKSRYLIKLTNCFLGIICKISSRVSSRK